MTNTISVPRELLLELRDSANDCYNNEVRRYKDDRRRIIYKALVDKADAILAQPAHGVASVPDGYEPTHKMVLAGERQWELSGNESPDCAAIYRAMIAAAPQPVSDDAKDALVDALVECLETIALESTDEQARCCAHHYLATYRAAQEKKV